MNTKYYDAANAFSFISLLFVVRLTCLFYCAQEEGEAEGVPVAFRYDVAPTRSFKTNVFRPKAVQGEVRAATLGSLFIGKFEMIPESKIADIVWEAWHDPTEIQHHVNFSVMSTFLGRNHSN